MPHSLTPCDLTHSLSCLAHSDNASLSYIMYTPVHMYIHTQICTCICIYTHIYTVSYAHTCIYTYTLYIYSIIHKYTLCIYTCKYIYTVSCNIHESNLHSGTVNASDTKTSPHPTQNSSDDNEFSSNFYYKNCWRIRFRTLISSDAEPPSHPIQNPGLNHYRTLL